MVEPNKCPECGTYVSDISWELEFEGPEQWDIVAYFHCTNNECKVEAWKAIYKPNATEVFSHVEEESTD
ncbi:MAG: hypothetical protein ACWGQW_03120 [bacterium]